MKKILVFLILVIISSSFAGNNPCGPDGILCRYEKMYDQYDSMRIIYPDEKAVVKNLLRTFFAGKALTSQINYLDNIHLEGYEGIILFPSPISKVISYKETTLGPDTLIIVKKVQEKTLAFDEQGSKVLQTISYQYTLTKVLGTWKIIKICQV